MAAAADIVLGAWERAGAGGRGGQPVLVLTPVDEDAGVSPCCGRRLPCHFCAE